MGELLRAGKFFWYVFFMFIILFFFTCYGMTVVALVPNLQVRNYSSHSPQLEV